MVQHYTLDENEAASIGVCSVVAAVENCSPLDLTPLTGVIDPDALDTFLAEKTATNAVAFEYCGYKVTATPDEIRVEELVRGNQ